MMKQNRRSSWCSCRWNICWHRCLVFMFSFCLCLFFVFLCFCLLFFFLHFTKNRENICTKQDFELESQLLVLVLVQVWLVVSTHASVFFFETKVRCCVIYLPNTHTFFMCCWLLCVCVCVCVCVFCAISHFWVHITCMYKAT